MQRNTKKYYFHVVGLEDRPMRAIQSLLLSNLIVSKCGRTAQVLQETKPLPVFELLPKQQWDPAQFIQY
jgi:hypothetical protein